MWLESLQLFLLLWVQPLITHPMFTWQKGGTDPPPQSLPFCEVQVQASLLWDYCKILIALSTEFFQWPSFLFSRDPLHQCLSLGLSICLFVLCFFSCILIGKRENWEFCLQGACLWFLLCLLPSSGPWLYVMWGKKTTTIIFLAVEWILKHDLRGVCGHSFFYNGYLEAHFEGVPYSFSWNKQPTSTSMGCVNNHPSASIVICFESLLQSLNVFSSAASSFSCAHSFMDYIFHFGYAYVLLSVYIPYAIFVYGNCSPF